MLKMARVTQTYGMKVFTNAGEFFGEIEDAIIYGNKIDGWKIRASKGSFLSKSLGGAKGVIVPHKMVEAIGDIFIVSRGAAPSSGEESEEEE